MTLSNLLFLEKLFPYFGGSEIPFEGFYYELLLLICEHRQVAAMNKYYVPQSSTTLKLQYGI